MSVYGYNIDLSLVDLDTILGDDCDILDLNVYLSCEDIHDFVIRHDGKNGDDGYSILFVGHYHFVNFPETQETFRYILELLKQPYRPLIEYSFSPLHGNKEQQK